METLLQIGTFAAETAVIVIAIGLILMLIAVLAARAQHHPEIEIELLHKKYKGLGQAVKSATSDKDERKAEKKRLKREAKDEKKQEGKSRIYVVDFEGDIKASAVENLRHEITAILKVATPQDEVVVRVESPGGVVHGYGLGAAQLMRVREKNIPLIVCVDKVAASGGYMMSCVANKILCAPFAIVGSIGVVAQVPNFHRLLTKHDIDYKEYTAGDFKRTVSLFGEITQKGEEKFKHQLELTHKLFKEFVHQHRPQLDLHQVATGEYWYGKTAQELGLVDEIRTSDDYLVTKAEAHHPVIRVTVEKKEKWSDKLSGVLGKSLHSAFTKTTEDLERRTLV